ncbi:MAG: four helix bundle protein [Ignavibacteria bacterium]|nr:four helix bundle protein [Ignavibacteria bacterium]
MALNDIEIYQLIRTAFALCDEVGTALKARREFNLADQLLRAALSVGNNFAEGYGRSATGERLMLMFYADGSAQECKNCLNSAVDLNIIEAGKALSTTLGVTHASSPLRPFALSPLRPASPPLRPFALPLTPASLPRSRYTCSSQTTNRRTWRCRQGLRRCHGSR